MPRRASVAGNKLRPWIPNGVGSQQHVKWSDPSHPHYHEYEQSSSLPPPPPSPANLSASRSQANSPAAALQATSAHRKYGIVALRKSAAKLNEDAEKSFKKRLDNCMTAFKGKARRSREELFEAAEREAVEAVERMRAEVRVIEREVDEKEENMLREEETEWERVAMQELERSFPMKVAELIRRVQDEGPDVTSRRRAHERNREEMQLLEREVGEKHRKELEEGALARLAEREEALARERERVAKEADEETRDAIGEMSAKLSGEAEAQIAAYREELEKLREARVHSARVKEKETTEIMVQEMKAKFIAQAEEEISLVSRDSEEDKAYALKQARDEISRFQALKATEITTNARARRAQALPAMAIELEERAEGIERSFREGLMGEDSKAIKEAVEAATEELRGHVEGCREAVSDDNELFVREITDEFMKARGRVLRARAEYLKVPIPSGGGGLDESGLLPAAGPDDPSAPHTSAPPASVKSLVSQFEQLRQRHLATGKRIVDAQMERLLLAYEVKAARVRRAERSKRGTSRRSAKFGEAGRSGRGSCPTCRPLTEANLELQRVAARGREDRSRSERSASLRRQPELSAAAIRSKYGDGEDWNYGSNSGRVSPGAESVSSAGSSREADFVKRFLGKVTKSSGGTLKGTLAMLNGGDGFAQKSLYDQPQHGGNGQHQHHHQQRQSSAHQQASSIVPTAYDDLISHTLATSILDSNLSVQQKRHADERLVKDLLDVTTETSDTSKRGGFANLGETPELLGRMGKESDTSFDVSPAVAAPALSVDSVNEFIEGGRSIDTSHVSGSDFRIIDSESEGEHDDI